LWKHENIYFLFTITRVAHEIGKIISILKTAENVSSLNTSSYPDNVPKSPFEYVDKNPNVTKTSIASVNSLNPSEIASFMHVELPLLKEPLLHMDLIISPHTIINHN